MSTDDAHKWRPETELPYWAGWYRVRVAIAPECTGFRLWDRKQWWMVNPVDDEWVPAPANTCEWRYPLICQPDFVGLTPSQQMDLARTMAPEVERQARQLPRGCGRSSP